MAQTNPSPNRRVLVVEDEPKLRAMLLRAIPDMGFEPIGAATGEDALQSMQDLPAAIVILDLNLPGIHGMAVFEKICEHWPQTQVIIMTGYGDLDAAQQSIRLGVVDFLTKPCMLGDLEHALDRAWRKRLDQQDHPDMARPSVVAAAPKDTEAVADRPQTLQDVEKQLILNALDRHDGNRAATANELGISVRTLYYRLSQYDIEEA